MLLANRDGMRRMADFDGADGMLFDHDADIDPTAVEFVMDGVAWFTDSGEFVGTASMAV